MRGPRGTLKGKFMITQRWRGGEWRFVWLGPTFLWPWWEIWWVSPRGLYLERNRRVHARNYRMSRTRLEQIRK